MPLARQKLAHLLGGSRSKHANRSVTAWTFGRKVSSIPSKDTLLQLSAGLKAVSFHLPHPLLFRYQAMPEVTWNQQWLPPISDAVHAPHTLQGQPGVSVGSVATGSCSQHPKLHLSYRVDRCSISIPQSALTFTLSSDPHRRLNYKVPKATGLSGELPD